MGRGLRRTYSVKRLLGRTCKKDKRREVHPPFLYIFMKKSLLLMLFNLCILTVNATLINPGETITIKYDPTVGEHGPSWTTDNPTLILSSTGFLCNVKASAYFGGTATVTCTYKDNIGNTSYERKRYWTFTCADNKISISPTTKVMKIDDSFQLSWKFDGITYIDPSIQFTGYDYDIINVSNNGLVTAKAEGTTKIYVKSNIGTNSAICSVTVNGASSNVTTGTESAYDVWDSSKTKVVTLEEAGTLSNFIPESDKYKITDLTIIGPLNGSDLRLLRDMCGLDINNKKTNGKLVVLDLKEAIFVSGGPWYVDAWGDYKYTYNEHFGMPYYAFAWMGNLKKIRFPKYCTTLTQGNLLQCSSLEYMAIPPGVDTLDKYSLNSGYYAMPMSVLTLPSSLRNFDVSIYKCKNLTDIYCYAVEPPSVNSSNGFKSQTNCANGTLYVPKGSAKLYWKAEGWREFGDIKETLDIYHTLGIMVRSEHGRVKFNNNEIWQKYGQYVTGWQAFEVKEGNEVIVEIKPDEGYCITEARLDYTPLTVSSDGIVKIDNLNEPRTLYVSFGIATSINNVQEEKGTTLDVYNLNGVLIRKNITEEELSTLAKGVYVINKNGIFSKFLNNK